VLNCLISQKKEDLKKVAKVAGEEAMEEEMMVGTAQEEATNIKETPHLAMDQTTTEEETAIPEEAIVVVETGTTDRTQTMEEDGTQREKTGEMTMLVVVAHPQPHGIILMLLLLVTGEEVQEELRIPPLPMHPSSTTKEMPSMECQVETAANHHTVTQPQDQHYLPQIPTMEMVLRPATQEHLNNNPILMPQSM
jgi:hypothetical protein